MFHAIIIVFFPFILNNLACIKHIKDANKITIKNNQRLRSKKFFIETILKICSNMDDKRDDLAFFYRYSCGKNTSPAHLVSSILYGTRKKIPIDRD